MEKEWIKPFFAALIAAAATYFKILTMPVFVLFVAMAADYCTGMIYAYISGTLSSRTGIFGIIKKLCYNSFRESTTYGRRLLFCAFLAELP